MSKNKEMIKALAATILGVLLIFLSINYFTYAGPAIAIGVFALLGGLFNVAGGLANLFGFAGKIPMLPLILMIGIPSSFLAFYFTVDLITIINSYNSLAPIGWIELIVSLAVELGAMTFIVLSLFLEKKEFSLLKFAFISVFLAFLVIRMIFALNGTTYDIGDIGILDLSFAVLFGIIAFEKPDIRKQEAETPKEELGEEDIDQGEPEAPSEQVLESEPETFQDDSIQEPQEPAEA